MREIHMHLISDSTGETIRAVARACLVQFEGVRAIERVWSLVRSEAFTKRRGGAKGGA